ncbi:hypothetical protein D3C80_827170 [compost metagenome]
MLGKHQSIHLDARIQLTQRAARLDIPQVRGQDQRTSAGSDLPFTGRGIYQPNVTKFTTPARQLVEHRIAKTHKVPKAVKRRG